MLFVLLIKRHIISPFDLKLLKLSILSKEFLLIIFKVGTLYSPLKVYFPAAVITGGLGVLNYVLTVINTGAFFLALNARMVEVTDSSLMVYKVRRNRGGDFVIGKLLADRPVISC